MKDLKHLYYFEKLLDDTYNDLARAAKEEGRYAIGHVLGRLVLAPSKWEPIT